jgi:membrane protease subunit HflC
VRRALLLVVVVVAVCVGLVAAGEVGLGPVVITREDEQKIILMLGRPRTVTQPGATLRIPLLEDARAYDRRLLYLNTEPLPIQTKDEERIVVDNYVVWRIADAVKFFASFPTGMSQAERQIDRVVRADVREVIGQHTLSDVLTGQRLAIMGAITEKTNVALAGYGIEVADVRINRTELPLATEQNVSSAWRARTAPRARSRRAASGRRRIARPG